MTNLRLRLLLLPLLTAGLLAGCGQSASEEKQGRQEIAQENEVHRLQQEVTDLKDQGKSAGAVSSATRRFVVCSPSVFAGPNTSCPFAINVRNVYYQSGQRDVNRVFSPTTGRTYTMTCSSDSPHFCTGGNNASVLFR